MFNQTTTERVSDTVAATPGYFLIGLKFDPATKASLQNITEALQSFPVVGWGIGENGIAAPLTFVAEPEADVAALLVPGGRVYEIGGSRVWSSLDDWKLTQLKAWQEIRKAA